MRTDIRPLNLGEILDRTFQIYRSNFALFAGLATVSSAANLVGQSAQTILERSLVSGHVAMRSLNLTNSAAQIFVAILALLVGSVVWAAMVKGVAAIYLNQATGVVVLLRDTFSRWSRLVPVTFCSLVLPWLPAILPIVALVVLTPMAGGASGNTAFAMIGIAVLGLSLLALIPLAIWLSMRYVLTNAVCAFEGTKLLQSLKRSALLTKDMRWRLFLLLMVVGIMQMVVGVVVTIPIWIPLHKSPLHPPLWVSIYTLLASFAASTLTTPIFGIAAALFYFDMRIRKEGLDIEWSMQASDGVEPGLLVNPSALPG